MDEVPYGAEQIEIRETELWRAVVGYEDYYQVSNLGNIYSLRSRRNLKCSPAPGGYIRVGLYADGSSKQYAVHRLVWEAFNGPIPEGMVINHLDCVRSHNMLANLQLCTQKANCNYGSAGTKSHLPDEELTPYELKIREYNRSKRHLKDAWIQAHPEKSKEQHRRYREEHLEEYREKRRNYMRKWRKENRELDLERKRQYRENLSEEKKEQQRQRHAATERKRRAAMSPEELAALYKKNAEYQRQRKANMTPEQLEEARKKYREWLKKRRDSMTEEEKERERKMKAEYQRARAAAMTEEQRQERRVRQRAYQKAWRERHKQ